MTGGGSRPLGIVGGMSWHSTVHYYRTLNLLSEARNGVHMNADCLIASLSFGPLLARVEAEGTDAASTVIAEAALGLERAGAGSVILAAFTAHFAAERLRAVLSVPFVDAGEALARTCRARGFRRVGLLGTARMTGAGHIAASLRRGGIEVLAPPAAEAGALDRAIAEDLTLRGATPEAGAALDRAVAALARAGADAAALACTELPLLLPRPNAPIPLIDGVESHLDLALSLTETTR